MARRTVPADPSIGERIRARRQLRRWSIRFAASRAGIAHTTWSRIEKGELRTDRYMVADLAAALECSVTDLTGQPRISGDRALESAHAQVDRVWRTLLEIAPDEPADRTPPPIEVLAARLALLDARRRACDYAAAGAILPDLLGDLHSAAAGPQGQAAIRLLVEATYAATFTLRSLGYVAESAIAAERCRQTAERLDQPAPLALADWTRAQVAISAGTFRRALTLTSRAADELDRHMDAAAAPEVLGMLHLSSAMCVLADRRIDDAREHVTAAERLAARTGETDSWSLSFGPTNVGIWRMGLEVDAGEPGRAVQVAGTFNPAHLDDQSRHSRYYVNMARALTDLGGRDHDAERALLTAERLAPQHVRSQVSARETARVLLDRSQRGSALRGLCERMGVAS